MWEGQRLPQPGPRLSLSYAYCPHARHGQGGWGGGCSLLHGQEQTTYSVLTGAEGMSSNLHDTELRKASIKHFYCNNKTWTAYSAEGRGQKLSLTKSLHEDSRGWEGTEGGKARKPRSAESQASNPGDAEAVMTSIIFLENTQGYVVVAGHPLGGESTNSTFNLNFPLKFLKFRKWSLDSYKITKVQKIH